MLEYPINAIKDSARPTYWVPDDEIDSCYVCDKLFDNGNNISSLLREEEVRFGSHQIISNTQHDTSNTSNTAQLAKLHHCRKCGQGVCDDCSRTKKPVPTRGWDQPVRVCDKCCAEELRTS